MTEAVIVAILGFAGTLLGSLFGILAAQKLTQYRLVQVEQQANTTQADVRTLENRTTKLEGRVTAAEHEINDLKKYHAP